MVINCYVSNKQRHMSARILFCTDFDSHRSKHRNGMCIDRECARLMEVHHPWLAPSPLAFAGAHPFISEQREDCPPTPEVTGVEASHRGYKEIRRACNPHSAGLNPIPMAPLDVVVIDDDVVDDNKYVPATPKRSVKRKLAIESDRSFESPRAAKKARCEPPLNTAWQMRKRAVSRIPPAYMEAQERKRDPEHVYALIGVSANRDHV